MNEPGSHDETLPAGDPAGRSGPEHEGARDPSEPLEAGSQVPFESDDAAPGHGGEDTVDGQESIVRRLADAAGEISRIHLRDVDDETKPVRVPRQSQEGAPLPAQIGRYRVAGEIARGGVGAVYRAHDVDLGRDVAIKVLLDDHRRSPDMMRRFIEEAQIGGQLQHPGICAIHEMGLLGGDRPFFTMKLVQGRTLAALLGERADPVAERQRYLGVFEQIAQTIAYAHARGVIHRDLKPSNVMVGAFGEVQVMDWGLAKVLTEGGAEDDRRGTGAADPATVVRTLRSSGSTSASLQGSVMGTPAYMPPEQARGDVADLDERSDVFGLGAILCEILTGKPPYEGRGIEEIYRKACHGELDSATARLGSCGADVVLLDLTRQCLAVDPAERPKDAGAVAGKISSYLVSLEERARALEIRAAKTRLRFALAVSMIVFLGIVAASFAWIEMDRRGRIAENDRAIRHAFVTANERYFDARRHGRNNPTVWSAAREAIARTKSLVMEETTAGLRADVARLSERIAILARFDELFAQTSLDPGDTYSKAVLRGSESGYADSIRRFLGIDLLSLETDEAAHHVRESGLAEEIATALEHWCVVQRTLGLDWRKPMRIAIAIDADRDPRRSQLRSALLDEETISDDEILQWLRDIDGSDHIHLVNEYFKGREDRGPLERALRTIVAMAPGSYHARLALGLHILRGPTAELDEALRHLEAAESVAPIYPTPRSTIAASLADAHRYDEALREWTSATSLQPLHAPSHRRAIRLLGVPTRFSRATLDAFVEQYRWLHHKYDEVAPLMREALALAIGRAAFARDDVSAAIRALEEIPADPGMAGMTREREWLIESWRRAALPAIPSYASVDAALVPRHVIFAGDAPWRLLRGEEAPPGDWTEPTFDDGSWERTLCPIGVVRSESPGAATILDDQLDPLTRRSIYPSFYLRRVFDLPDPDRFESAEVTLRSSEGWVIYLNNVPIASQGVEYGDEPIPHEARSTVGTLPTNRQSIELPRALLRKGKNVLAIRVLFSNQPIYRFLFEASVHGRLQPELAQREIDRRLAAFREATPTPGSAERIAYFESRLLEAKGDFDAAIAGYRRIIQRDRSSREPFDRLATCLLAHARNDATECELRGLLTSAEHPSFELWHSWLDLCLDDLGRTPRETLELLPARAAPSSVLSDAMPLVADRYHEDVRWLLTSLATDGAVRINCGGGKYRDREGRVWAGDRFFRAGSLHHQLEASREEFEIANSTDAALYQTNRWFYFGDFKGYRIPLPPGRFRVTLHAAEIYFASPGRRVFDILIESKVVASELDLVRSAGLAQALRLPVDVDVDDGVLDIEFIHRVENPLIAAIEIERSGN